MSQGILSPNSRSSGSFNRLPYEAWLHCMKFAVEESAAGPLPYLAVSYEWCTTIIDTPSLWTSIVIDNGEDEAARIQVFIQLSQQQLVDIIYVNSKDGNMLHYVLRECASRVSSIIYTPRRTFLDANEDKFLMVLNEITSEFPVLMTLIGVCNVPVPRRLLSASPNLRTIRESPVSVIDEPYMGLMVQEVEMDVESPDNIIQLSRRRELRSFSTARPSSGAKSPIKNPKPVSPKIFVQRLAMIMGHQLTDLGIRLSFESFWTFAALLSAFSRLRFLDLSVDLTSKKSGYEVTPRMSCRTIQSLYLKIRVSEYGIQSEALRGDTDDEATLRAQMSAILRAFTTGDVLQCVETLYLYSLSICTEDDLGRWIRSALDVRTITVITARMVEGQVSLPPRQAYSPILSLNSACLVPPGLLNLFNAPNLTDLILPGSFMSSSHTFKWSDGGFGSNLINLTTTSAHLDPRPATRSPYTQPVVVHTIKRLIITDSHMFTDHSNLDHFREGRSSLQWLREISFDSGEHWGSAGPEVANQFLYFLYEQPEICPHLTTIKILGYPFWELLFKVICQRYFSNVQSITRVSLPRLPVYGILRILVGCLGGKEEACNGRDIDDVIWKRLSSSKYINACTVCARGGYIYCEYSSRKVVEDAFDSSFQELLDIFHPHNTDGHATRYLFEKLMEDPKNRGSMRDKSMRNESMCNWQIGYNWVDITEHTLDGEVFVTGRKLSDIERLGMSIAP